MYISIKANFKNKCKILIKPKKLNLLTFHNIHMVDMYISTKKIMANVPKTRVLKQNV